MRSVHKPIRLSGHAMQQLLFRGGTEGEVIEAIRSEEWQPAEFGRLECQMNLTFDSDWNRKHYRIKQVRPIFAEEQDEIVVVTVYVYYF